jgi:hypothetical protein
LSGALNAHSMVIGTLTRLYSIKAAGDARRMSVTKKIQ